MPTRLVLTEGKEITLKDPALDVANSLKMPPFTADSGEQLWINPSHVIYLMEGRAAASFGRVED